ncbi:hypothetical protein [Swaminathania salitolerans]|uniref:Tail protein n=1 Tax=Swaminathania salitolerans TaxID=182838 RepID=A0A511BP67_9PROT|nr:hypothetical protein [Swaminathania salitolerans]GBQ14740.1 hypothetical protein AA21291_1941 [Swaminathania salitolerans LMG 21291]GEL01872.1 hypothetical protein SSA02_10350 [Swaminathania salitolerans]
MLSDIVWNDAYTRAQLVAKQQGLALVDALEQQSEDRPVLFWRMEAQASQSDRLGIGEVAMEEEGELSLHLTIRAGSISTPDALSLCKGMSVMFRARLEGVQPLPDGLFYDGQSLFPPDPDTGGNWFTMTLIIQYRYQDLVR